jgi:hypothetical protein
MVLYTCPRCGYPTSNRSVLEKHAVRKKACKPKLANASVQDILDAAKLVEKITEHQCKFCSKYYSHRQSLDVHEEACELKQKEANAFTSGRSAATRWGALLPTAVAANDRQLKILQAEVERLKHQVACSSAAAPSTVVNNTNIVNNNQTIKVVCFGKEDIAHLEAKPYFKNFMAKCISTSSEGICDLITHKYFHGQCPQNHNIRKPRRNDPFIDVNDGKRWKPRLACDVLDQIMESFKKEFAKFLRSGVELKKEWLVKFAVEVCIALDWDLDIKQYDDDKTSQEKKDAQKKQLYALFSETIYQRTLDVHKNGKQLFMPVLRDA